MSTRILAALLVLGIVAGCEGLEPIVSAPPPPPPRPKQTIPFRRVALVEFYDEAGHNQAAKQLTALLRQELAEITVSSDFIVVETAEVPSLRDPFARGSISVKSLVEIRKRYKADAVIVGSVDAYNPYWKPSVHLALKVIDTADASVRYEMSEGWDAKRDQVRRDMETYFRRDYGGDDCRFGPDLLVDSPASFLRFVANEVAYNLASSM